MIDKIKKYTLGDNLFFQKAGLLLGAFVGLVLGFIISDKADGYVIEEIAEVEDGSPKTD